MPTLLSISLVTYAPDLPLLRETLASLAAALAEARRRGELAEARLVVVDNGPGEAWAARLQELLAPWGAAAALLSGHGNVGFGRGHNLALARCGVLDGSAGAGGVAHCHLLLNPDVVLAQESLAAGLALLRQRPEVGLAAPLVLDDEGQPGHLCKACPTLANLFARGFLPARWRGWAQAGLARYERRDLPLDRVSTGIEIASGCFMLCRAEALAGVGGFDPGYFLYFEDFDLSLRLGRQAQLALVPEMAIRHFGGHAARKGWRHVALFFTSAWRFFHCHGWRWW